MKSTIFLLVTLITSGCCLAQEMTWKELPAEGEPLARHENAMVAVGDKILLIGGRGEKPVDIYNTREKTWTNGAQPPLEIHHVQAVNLDGLVYILGAFTGSWPYETPLSHVLIYDVAEDTWSIGAEIPENRRRGAAGVVTHQDKIYLINGIINGHTSGWVNWLDEYDPYKDTWKILPNSPVARDHFQSAVIDNQLYVAGGRRSGSAETGFAGTVKETNVYDFNTGSWKTLADIPTPRAGTAAAVLDNKFVVIGGESDTQEISHNEVEAYDVKSNTWNRLTPVNIGRHGTQAVYLGDKIIIGSGSGNRGGGPELTSFEILSGNEDQDFALEPINAGELSVSKKELSLSSNASGTVQVTNPGEKAVVISYVQLDDRENFSLDVPQEGSFILGPQETREIGVTASGTGKAASANLFIKSLGNSQPLQVKISR